MGLFKSFKGIPFIIVFQSLLIAFYADVKCINWTLAYGYSSKDEEGGFMSILYAGVIFMLLICAKVGRNNVSGRISRTSVMIVLLLIIFYMVTLNFIGPPRIIFPMFMVMVIASILLPNLVKVNARILIKAIMFFPTFAIFKMDKIFAFKVDWKDVISMDASYAFLVPICAAIVYMYLYYREEEKWDKVVTLVLFIINMIFFAQILQYGSRGPILSVLLMIVFLYLIKQPESIGVRKKEHLMAICIFGIIVLFFSFYSMISVIGLIAEFNGVSFHFVEKIVALGAEEDLTNGRDMINGITINGIMDNPICGHGFDMFDAITGLGYPHNVVLQLLYDGGIILFLCLVIPLIKSMSQLLSNCTKGEYAVFTVLFFSSVPGAFFSGDSWGLAVFWLFYGYMLSRYFVIEEDKYSY